MIAALAVSPSPDPGPGWRAAFPGNFPAEQEQLGPERAVEVKVPGTKTARPLGVSGRNPVVDHSPGQGQRQARHQCNPSPTTMRNWTGLGYLDTFRQSRQLRNHDFLCMTATPRNTATTPRTRLS